MTNPHGRFPAHTINDGTLPGRYSRGELNCRAKLTADDVRAIRASTETPSAIVRRFPQISPQHVCNIRARRVWRHLA